MASASLKAVLSAVDNLSPVLKRVNFAGRLARKSLLDIARTSADLARPLALLGGAAGVGGVVMGAKGIVGVSAQFEDFGATLETLLGSAAKSKEALGWIRDFAAKTPYELSDTTRAFVELQTLGLNPTKGALKAVGDIASLFNKPLEEATASLASAMRGNTEMLDQFGIQAKIVGDRMRLIWTEDGKKFGGIVNKDDSTAIASAVARIWERLAGGNMDRKSRQWSGMVSNLQDTWTNFLHTIGEAGFFEYAEKRLGALLSKLQAMGNDGSLQRWAAKISGGLVKVFERLERWGQRFNLDAFLDGIERLAGRVAWLSDKLGGADRLLAVFMGLLAAPAIAAVLNIAGAVLAFGGAVGKAAMALGGLAFANPLLTVLAAAIMGLAYAGYRALENWDAIKAGLLKTWEDTKDAAQSILDAIKQGFADLWNAPRIAAEEFFGWLDGKLESMRGIAERVGGFFGLGGGGGGGAASSLPASVAALADNYAGRYEIPGELLRRLIQAESGGNPGAVSKAGAMGLMQLMPATAKRFGVRDPFDPAQNIAGGTAYLSYLLDRYRGNQAKALAAYNAGEGNVDKYGGVPPFKETQGYVDKILGAGRRNIQGDVTVRFENAPAGMRVDEPRRKGPLSITPEVGYRSFAGDR